MTETRSRRVTPASHPPQKESSAAVSLARKLRTILREPLLFVEHASGVKLRAYQRGVAEAICRSVLRREGLTFVVIFPRQSGKNELQAQLEAYLLVLFSPLGAEIVKVSPTYKPQSLNAMRRLERVLTRNQITKRVGWAKEEGYIFRVGLSRIYFFSAAPGANIVGATASTLLEVDEAQDVDMVKFDKDVNPMAASTNATKVFWGTAWTSQTLLAREYRAALAAERSDGRRRVWRLTAEEVGAEVAAYQAFVAEQVTKLGRNHPLVKTQYFSEDIDAEGGMFPPARRALMQGTHLARVLPEPGKVYAVLLDVAGEDEDMQSVDDQAATRNTRRDATALTVIEIDRSTLSDPLVKAPRYLVVNRRLWIGIKQSGLYSAIRGIADHWRALWIVVDATGVGAGLASFLDKAYPGKVLPFVFTSASKSQLAWDFLGVVESGRYKEHVDNLDSMQARFWREVDNVQMEVQPGPNRLVKWGTPNGAKVGGEFIHDDLVLSAALCAVLDDQEWQLTGTSLIVTKADPLKEMDKGF